ncbi:hypothetical protein FUAX_09240 [Fulvitalea axinellae]|uniref:Uncharacterized protein n=1 Tax=Fulvitalea axinellae TaxID=1182444 RepID=A0AAU9CNI3_9BACT|nr:hypothetical protein FUAX_09240 [Fulvitalea axinellae]
MSTMVKRIQVKGFIFFKFVILKIGNLQLNAFQQTVRPT